MPGYIYTFRFLDEDVALCGYNVPAGRNASGARPVLLALCWLKTAESLGVFCILGGFCGSFHSI